MKKVIAFNGGPRKTGNTSIMLRQFLEGVDNCGGYAEEFLVNELNLEYCHGCLRCNLLGRCSVTTDDWPELSRKITEADVIVFATPVYFHHVTAPLKKIIDRFRSFVHVQITEEGLLHTPVTPWNKDLVLIMSLGSSDDSDAKPVIELFRFMNSILGKKNRLHIITATRMAVVKQILKTSEELRELYLKMNLSPGLAGVDFLKNQEILKQCYDLGSSISR